MAMDISRRSFLKGAAAIAEAESKAAESTVAAPAAMPAGFAPTGKDCTYGAYLNPQDPSGFADSGDLSHLFSPLKIGHVTLKNRIVKSAAGSEMQDNTVWPSDAALAYYGQFCDGGVGMVCCEAAISLARMGKTVTVVNTGSKDQMYMNAATWPRMMGKNYLLAKGVKFWHNAVIEQITAGGVDIESESGVKVHIPADHVINALPKATNRALFDELTAAGMHVFAVGDCYSPSTIANAVARANIVARNVEKQQQTATVLAGDQVYTATATGIGDVTVSIRVEGGQIIEALVDTANETQGIGRELGEQFAREIVEKHSIDAVSGATVTTNAANQALAQCLKQAGL